MQRRFEAGTVIIREGEISGRAYLIVRGRVRITRHQHNHDVQLAEIGPNGLFGEMSMIDQKPRSASVTALVETDCVELNLTSLKSIMTQSPNTCIVVFKALCTKLRDANERLIRGFSTEEVCFWYRVVTVCRLWHDCNKDNPRLRHNLDSLRKELAAALGFSLPEIQPFVNKLIAIDIIGEPRSDNDSIIHMDVLQLFLNSYEITNVTESGSAPLTLDDLQVGEDILAFAEERLPANSPKTQLVVPTEELNAALLQSATWPQLNDSQRSQALQQCYSRLSAHGLLGYRFGNRKEVILIIKRLRMLMSLDVKPGGEFEKTCRTLTTPT